MQCSLCHEWFHFRCTQLSKNIKGKTISWTCNSFCFRPATSRVSVVTLREISQNLEADATSQRGLEPESDIAVGLCPIFSQSTNYPSQNDIEATPQGDSQSPNFWNKFLPSARDKLFNICFEVVHWKPKIIGLNKCKSSNAFAELLDETLRPLADNTSHTSRAMTAEMGLPHLILARTQKGTDSVNKTVIRRLQLWNQGKLDELLKQKHSKFGRAVEYNASRNPSRALPNS